MNFLSYTFMLIAIHILSCIQIVSTLTDRNIAVTLLFICIYLTVYISSKIKQMIPYCNILLFSLLLLALSITMYSTSYSILIFPVATELFYNLRKRYSGKLILAAAIILLAHFWAANTWVIIILSSICVFLLIHHLDLAYQLITQNIRHLSSMDAIKGHLKTNDESSLKNIYLARLEERNTLTSKLHDEIGHTISAGIMQIEAVRTLIDDKSSAAHVMLGSTADNLRLGMDSIRLILRDEKPAQVQIGLGQLELLLTELKLKTGIEYSLSYSGDLSHIDIGKWSVISQALLETTTNIMKHSNATALSVAIQVLNKIIRVEFRDNGTVVKPISHGMGLLGITERVMAMGGRASFETDGGFMTLLIFPIAE